MRRGIHFVLLVATALATILPTAAMSQPGDTKAWSIVATFNLPETASGLAWDGTYLYCGIYGTGGNSIYRINPSTGAYTLQCTGPQEDAYGLTFDGTNLVTTDHPSSPAKAIKFNMSGTLVSQFNLPAQYMSGIAYDNGNYWVARYYPDPSVIYKVNSSGTVLRQFTAPDNQPWDLCLQDGYLWMADYWGDKLYKIDTTTGTAVENHASQSIDPAGIVWDGQYLWYCDDGGSTTYDRLYKVDLSGAGTPVIYLPAASHDYGIVTIGSPATWDATVQNTGTANLTISGVTISGSGAVTCPTTFPITISASDDTTLRFIFAPLSPGPLSAIAQIASNDPIHPTTSVSLTGNAVNPGPDINVPVSSFDYGTVRAGAFTRWMMLVRNTGDQLLTISSITSSDPHFTIDNRVTLPIYVYPLDTARVGIWFRPLASQAYSATIAIGNNDPDANPYSVSLQGTGLKTEYPIGDTLWSHTINGGLDNSPKAMAWIPDINGDERSDLIVCSEDYTIRAMNGNADSHGDVLWEHVISSGSVYNQNSLAIIQDINGDGYTDIVVGAAGGACLIRAISGKTGTEIWTHDTHEYGDGGWVYQVNCDYDYNNDGVTDVLAATGDDAYDVGPKRAYCLNGLTGVSIWERPLNGPVFSVIGVEDFNGDGKPDAVAGASTADETTGKTYGINGANGAVLWTLTVSGSSVWALAQIDDINGDGTKDVAIGDFSYSAGVIYGVNVKTGGVVWTRPGFGMILRLEKFSDLNDDGHPDLVPAHAGTAAIAINGQTGEPIWTHYLADKCWSVARGNDVTGDAINDVFVGTLYQNNYCYFLDGKDGSEARAIPFDQPIDAMAAIPDVVGDESMEMVAGGREGALFCFSGGLNSINNLPPSVPSNPTPSDGATNILFTTLLSWTGGDPDQGDAVNYDIYLGTTNPPPQIGSTESVTTFDPPGALNAASLYFWQVICKDEHSSVTYGPIWRFTTGSAACGDADGNGMVNISDVVYLVAYIFSGGPAPNPLSTGDVDCNGFVNITDAVYLITYIFGGGPAPCASCK